jgi:hypothetical protein
MGYILFQQFNNFHTFSLLNKFFIHYITNRIVRQTIFFTHLRLPSLFSKKLLTTLYNGDILKHILNAMKELFVSQKITSESCRWVQDSVTGL